MEKFSEWACKKTFWIITIPAFIVFVFTAAVPIYLSFQPGSWKISHEVNGAIGDFFGGILNPTIAFMALVWLVKGVRLQQKELEETKIALQNSEKHQAAQVRISAITALISSINDEHSKLRAYRQTLEVKLDKIIEEYERKMSKFGSQYEDKDSDLNRYALVKELNHITAVLSNYENQRNEYTYELREILKSG